jgi:hypothetical protein
VCGGDLQMIRGLTVIMKKIMMTAYLFVTCYIWYCIDHGKGEQAPKNMSFVNAKMRQ